MPIIQPAIRPPAEASNFLLQITLGCSSNQCTFCGAYFNKSFTIKDSKEIMSDIAGAARHFSNTRRVFLLDGDALVVNNDILIPILKKLDDSFPKLSRVASYANGYNIAKRTDEELKQLYDHKLRLIYMGLESGSQDVLDFCKKRSTVDEMVEAVQRSAKAGIKASVIVLLGLGGRKYSRDHVKSTVEALNRMQPRNLSFLSLMVIPETPLAQQVDSGEFEKLTTTELLKEAYDIIYGLELNKTIFRSDHASNHLSLAGRFPQDKKNLLHTIESALGGKINLRPEYLRGL